MLEFVPLVLAAGKGTRMKSAFPKVLHSLLGKPMVIYVLNALRAATIFPKIGVIIGYKAQEVQAAIAAPDIDFILQPQPMGTGHALMCAQPFWENALIGAGSVITEDVPADTLAIARGKQVHKPNSCFRTNMG